MVEHFNQNRVKFLDLPPELWRWCQMFCSPFQRALSATLVHLYFRIQMTTQEALLKMAYGGQTEFSRLFSENPQQKHNFSEKLYAVYL